MTGRTKITEINLEAGMPTVEVALKKLRNELTMCRHTGSRAAILIHGYGSSGSGGSIRTAARKLLSAPEMVGIVRAYCPGENWETRKKAMLDLCGSLQEREREISGNFGVTVVVLR